MRIGMIGMGRMGSAMARRLLRAGHGVVVYDVIPEVSQAVADEGATFARTITDFVTALLPPRIAWMMLPAAVVDAMIEELAPLLQPGDVIIDGGNSFYGDDIRRADAL